MKNSDILLNESNFKEFTKKLVAVPKKQIDEQLKLEREKKQKEKQKKK